MTEFTAESAFVSRNGLSVSPRPRKKPESPPGKNLRRIRRNRFWLLLYLWLAAVWPELVLHAAVSQDVADYFHSGLLWGPLFALFPAMVVFVFCTAGPRPGMNYLFSVGFIGGLFLLYTSELVWFRSTGTFWSVSSVTKGDFPLLFQRMLPELGNSMPEIILLSLPLLLMVTMGRRFFSFRPLKHWTQHIPMIIGCVLVHLLTVGILPLFGGTGPASPYGLYRNGSDLRVSVSQLGLITALRREGVAVAIESIHPTEVPSSTPEPEFIGLSVVVPEEPAPTIDLDALAGTEQNPDIARLHRWFAARTPAKQNGKTGLFSGFNLIQIVSPALRASSVSEDQTPALHRLTAQGYLLADYHTPCQSIFSLLTGLPDSGSGSCEAAVGKYMPLTMAQQLIRRGYSTWAVSPEQNRTYDAFVESLGYELLSLNTATACEALDLSSRNYVNQKRFHVLYLLDESQSVQDLDGAVTLLLTRLETAGVLDHTVVVLSSDAPERIPSAESDGLCVIWKSGMEPETIDSPTWPADLLPTLSNLFGLDFDSRLYLGRDLFGPDEGLVCYPNGSWITDTAIYNAETGIAVSLSDKSIRAAYTESICAEVNSRFFISRQILIHDYWRYLSD